jgi:hypothetical protein
MSGRSRRHKGKTQTIEMTIYLVRNVTNGLFACRANKLSRASSSERKPLQSNRWGAFPGQETNLWFVDSYVANSNWITRFSGSIYLVVLWDESLASSNRDECLEHGSGERVIV